MKTAFLPAGVLAVSLLVTVGAKAAAASGPVYLNQLKSTMEADEAKKRSVASQPKNQPKPVKHKRKPASDAQTSEAVAKPGGPVGTQISFFEISPSIGSMSIASKQAFSLGTNFSFRVTKDFPAYFEPSVFLSFFNGLNDQNGTLWHIDGGLRLDFAIDGSALVPFIKGAVGPTLASSSNIVQENGQKIPDSYLNAFLGGGVKVLLSEHIAPRLDVGTTLQNSSFGLYMLGSAVLPL